MSAEKHVEPLGHVSGRGARGGSPGRSVCTCRRSRFCGDEVRSAGCGDKVGGSSAAAPAKQPSSAQVAAVRAACQSDYPKVCAGVPPGGAPALQCLAKNKAKVSANCQQAVNAATGGAAAPAATATAAPGAAAAAPAPAALVLRPMRPREELFVLRSACGADVQTLCNGVAPGGGRIIQCLVVRSASLSPACRGVLAQFAAQ